MNAPRIEMPHPRADVLSLMRRGALEVVGAWFALRPTERRNGRRVRVPAMIASAASRQSPSIAASTLGGDIGSDVMRLPIACSIALAIAAIGGQMFTSATPLAP